MKWFMNLKARYFWIMFVVMLLVCIGACVLCAYINDKTITVIVLLVVFLLTGAVFETAVSKTIAKKMNKMKYSEVKNTWIGMENTVSKLNENNFISSKLSFGSAYIKIIDNIAYKVTFITNSKNYLNPNEADQKGSGIKGLDKCKLFIGFEIFVNVNDEVKDKVKNFSFNGDKVYYEGYIWENDILTEPNHVDPLKAYEENYNFFRQLLSIEVLNDKKDN